MSDRLYKQIFENFGKKSTRELKSILANRDTGEWSEDAISVAEELIAKRPDEPDLDDRVVVREPIDRRGQAVFELTDTEIADYRGKIQMLGWLLCIAGALGTFVLCTPIIFAKINGYSVAEAVLGLIIGLVFAHTGIRLIRLDPRARVTGIGLSLILLPFFPIGTVVGICGLLWLGKRGSVMTSAPSVETKNTEQAGSCDGGDGSPNSKKDVARRWMSWLVRFLLSLGGERRISNLAPKEINQTIQDSAAPHDWYLRPDRVV